MPIEDIAPLLGAAANFIPGVGPAVGGVITALGGLFGGNKRQRAADKAAQQQAAYVKFLQGHYDSLLKEAEGQPYPEAGPYDPYSPSWNAARSGEFRDDTAKALQSTLAGTDYYLRPQGGVRSSAMEYAKAQAVRDAGAQNAAFMRNLRIQGGIERYNNSVKASQDRFNRIQSTLGAASGIPGQYGNVNQNEQGAANDIYGGLSGAVKAIMSLGKPGAKTGADRGNNTMATNQKVPSTYQVSLGGGTSETAPLTTQPYDPNKWSA
jgi:hypothetical protein